MSWSSTSPAHPVRLGRKPSGMLHTMATPGRLRAAKDLGTYAVTGKMDTSIKDWNLYLNSALASVISVPASSDIKTVDDLVKALKAGGMKVGTSGVNSAGHSAIEALVKAVDGSYIHAAYDGGAAAVLSTISGETDISSQLISEQIDMLRAGKLRAIAILSDADTEVPGVGTIPSIATDVPNVPLAPIYFGIFLPGDIPADVASKMEEAWSKLATSKALADYTKGRGSIIAIHSGEEAQKKVWPSIQLNAWLLHDGGQSATSPDELGIPRP